MRDVVLVDLNHGDDGRSGIGQGRFTTKPDDSRVMHESSNHSGGRIWGDNSIGVNLQHEFVESRVDSNDVSNLMMHLELERAHRMVVVNSIQESHNDHLRVSFTTVSGPDVEINKGNNGRVNG